MRIKWDTIDKSKKKFSFLYLLCLWFSDFPWGVGIPWGILPLTPPVPPHLCGPEAVGLGCRPTVWIFAGSWVVAPLRALHQPLHPSHYIRHRALPFEAFERKQKDWTGEDKENKSPGRLLSAPPAYVSRQLLVSPARPIGITAWSECICQFFTLLSCGSVLTGVSRAGTADVASSALAGEEEREEGLEVLPSPLSCPRCSRTCPRPVTCRKPLALLRRRLRSSSRFCTSGGDEKNPTAKAMILSHWLHPAAVTSQSGFRLSCLGPGKFQESNQAGQEEEHLVRIVGQRGRWGHLMTPRWRRDQATLFVSWWRKWRLERAVLGRLSPDKWRTQQGASTTHPYSMSTEGLYREAHPISPLDAGWIHFPKFMHRTRYWFTEFAANFTILTAGPANPCGQLLGFSAIPTMVQMPWRAVLVPGVFDDMRQREGLQGEYFLGNVQRLVPIGPNQ